MTTPSKTATSGLARLIVWVAFALAIIGGIATRGTGYSRWVAKMVTHGNTWWLPFAVFVLLTVGLVWSLADRSPDLLSMFAVLTIPSVVVPAAGGGLIGQYLNWPLDFVHDLLASSIGMLFGKGATVAGFAGLCWFLTTSVGVFALVRFIRAHAKRGGKSGGNAPVPVSGNLADVLAAARKGAK